jgi:hypothetical protein
VCKCKKSETIPGMRGDEREWCGEWIQLWYIWYIIRTFVNAIMYLSSAQQFKKIKSLKIWKNKKYNMTYIWLFFVFYFFI